ncbi:hypothetical protein ACIQU2_27455 [Pseudomonas sp. NPDC098740]|uniref:hypothetical protein n=1 Tax=Pseudomonas sp. NPDC098740 TaxID=3364486 RepID=UPI003839D3BE
MTTGLLTPSFSSFTSLSLGSSAGVVLFTEDTQRLICITVNRKAAAAGGIEAIAARAIDTGDHDEALQLIIDLAAELRQGLQILANLAGQLETQKAA